MSNPVDPLLETTTALRAAWGAASSAHGDARAMTAADLLDMNERIAAIRRQLDGLHTQVAAEMAARSRPELGKDGLARQAGFRTPARLIAASTGGHVGDAVRLIQVGEATRERSLLSGESAPPRHPEVARAVSTGAISVAAASAITGMLDRIALRVDMATWTEAERALVGQAPLLSLEELHAVLRRAEAHLDPDGLEPATDEMHGERSLKIGHDASGMTVLTARLDPESAAPVVAAIDAIVTAQLRTSRGHNTPDGVVLEDGSAPVAAESRSLPQLRADALAAICRHAIGCDSHVVPGPSASVIVRMDLDHLTTGTGIATIDGIEQPIDAGAARRLAAAANIIPCVLGTDSEVLDFGRSRRHFTKAQRRALVERDGGCAFCHLPPPTPKRTTSSGGCETTDPPTSTTGSSSARHATTGCTQKDGRSGSKRHRVPRHPPAPSGSSHPRTSIPTARHAWAGEDASTPSPSSSPPEPIGMSPPAITLPI